jgi:5-methyltetrahydrofolate--homocysteine methyltransferase
MMRRERSAFSHWIRTEHGSFIVARFVWGLTALAKEKRRGTCSFGRSRSLLPGTGKSLRENMTRTDALMARLRAGEVLLADGAAGTLLHSMGLPSGTAPEVWVLEEPDKIRALYQRYVEAGSDLILSSSFGGTHFRLSSHGLGDRVIEINRRAAELARTVAGNGVWVVGDMGPTGQLLKPLGKLTAGEVAGAFAEQAEGLTQGGADILLIETMSDLGEAQAAIEGIRRATDLPIVCTFSFDSHGRTMMGLKPETMVREISPLVEIVGANCGKDPAEFVGIVALMRRAAPDAVIWAKPNAGLPRVIDERVAYDATPEFMGQVALQLREAGARIIGGCCGTTPDHISAMAVALRSQVATHQL